MYRIVSTLLLAITFISVSSQDLFEDAASGLSDKNFQIGGYIRGVSYLGQENGNHLTDLKSVYGESAVNIDISGGDFAAGYAEIRLRKGFEFGAPVSEIDLREAFIELNFEKFDIKAGNQIVAWGRADGWNPTNIITPQDPIVRSPEPDDIYTGNLMANINYQLSGQLSIEGIWIPVYKPSVIPITLSDYPGNISFLEGNYPDTKLKNGSFALKVDANSARAGGSVSYFNGYQILPGIDLGNYEFDGQNFEMEFLPRAYHEQRIGLDFSTTFGSFGLRAEAAWQIPTDDYEAEAYIPNPDIEYVIGLEKDIGKLNIIAQYIGIAVLEYKDMEQPTDPEGMILNSLEKYNRLISMHQDEFSHIIFLRPSLLVMHNNLQAELLSMYNFTTEEIMISSKISYDLSDVANISAGYNYYYGKENTLYDMIDSIMNGLFAEIRVSF